MKKSLIFAVVALVAFVGCAQIENPGNDAGKVEMNFTPLNGNVATRGYTLGTEFKESSVGNLHPGSLDFYRTMQISAYLYPQNGEAGNYFVDKTYSNANHSTTWWNTNTIGGTHEPIYWPVGGTMDFLAYSFSAEPNTVFDGGVVWDDENAASQVVIDVPGENSQNDILYASAYGQKAPSSATPVAMKFNHAQAWLEFELTGTVDAGVPVVHLNRIELENVYNAGVLTIKNNKGNATATWDFSGETKKNIEVDNEYKVKDLKTESQFLDMLFPQQKKTAFVIYYTLGKDTQELSYRFTTDQKTWLMGEKYVYKINITTTEVTVNPTVTVWADGDVADVNAQTTDGKIF